MESQYTRWIKGGDESLIKATSQNFPMGYVKDHSKDVRMWGLLLGQMFTCKVLYVIHWFQ